MKQDEITALEKVIKKDYANTSGIVALKEGKIVFEKYFNSCNSNSRIHIYSVTKSIISILIGIAHDKGYIKNINQKVLDFFPEYQAKEDNETIKNITLKDMLTMTVPYKYSVTSPPYIEYFTSKDFVKFSLDLLGGEGKIGEFAYAPLIGPDIFSGIIMKATKKSVLDFAKENLFTPLGINVEKNIVFHSEEEQMAFYQSTDISGWVADESGTNTGGWGLTLCPLDMAKIGQLYLNKGVYNGKQILSKKWVDESLTKHSQWNDLSYGYLWWLLDEKENTYAALGDGGNTIYVNDDKKIVVAITGTFMPNARDRIDLIKTYIEPMI